MFYVKYISIIHTFFKGKKRQCDFWLSSRSLALERSHVVSTHMEKYYGRTPKPSCHSYTSKPAVEPPAPVKSAETTAPAELTACLKPHKGP